MPQLGTSFDSLISRSLLAFAFGRALVSGGSLFGRRSFNGFSFRMGLFLIFARVGDEVGDNAKDHREGKRSELDGGVAEGEIEDESADAADEDRGDGEEVAVVIEVDFAEHLETRDRDEAIESDASAAHDALRDGVDEGDEGRDEGEEDAAAGSDEDGDDRSVPSDSNAADGFAIGGIGRAAD